VGCPFFGKCQKKRRRRPFGQIRPGGVRGAHLNYISIIAGQMAARKGQREIVKQSCIFKKSRKNRTENRYTENRLFQNLFGSD
jgi:hypothetical protein